jgi:hypothetical protein
MLSDLRIALLDPIMKLIDQVLELRIDPRADVSYFLKYLDEMVSLLMLDLKGELVVFILKLLCFFKSLDLLIKFVKDQAGLLSNKVAYLFSSLLHVNFICALVARGPSEFEVLVHLPSELMSVIAFVNDDVVALEHSS